MLCHDMLIFVIVQRCIMLHFIKLHYATLCYTMGTELALHPALIVLY